MDIQMIQSALQNIHYPINKEQLVQQMEEKGMTEGKEMLQQHLPEGQMFNNAGEVMSKLPLGNLAGKFGM